MNVPLICDCGSGISKVGCAGTEAPLAMFPTILGKLRHDKLLVGMEEEDWFIGNEVQKNRGKLNLKYPISQAAITNWDNMEKIWRYSFHQVLHVAPEQHPLMLTEPPLNPMSNKEKVSQPFSLHGAWVGGFILCSLSTFKDMWVTSEECKDIGSSFIRRITL
ncbi:uncharacterized protein AAG666_017913 [Megaptera novaeangliae]